MSSCDKDSSINHKTSVAKVEKWYISSPTWVNFSFRLSYDYFAFFSLLLPSNLDQSYLRIFFSLYTAGTVQLGVTKDGLKDARTVLSNFPIETALQTPEKATSAGLFFILLTIGKMGKKEIFASVCPAHRYLPYVIIPIMLLESARIQFKGNEAFPW